MKRKIFVVTILGSLFLAQTATAELKVGTNGNVGIGTEPGAEEFKVESTDSPAGSFSSSWNGAAASKVLEGIYTGTNCANVYGVYGSSTPCSARGYGGVFYGGFRGVHGAAKVDDTTGNRYGVFGTGRYGAISYGVYGYALDSTDANYGLRGQAKGASSYGVYASGETYAGYFVGDLAYTGSLIQAESDERLKENIQPLDNVLSKVMNLKAKSFNYKKDAPEYKSMNMAEGKRFGLIAQELEQVFPELVSDEVFIEPDDDQADPMDESAAPPVPTAPKRVNYKSINYIEMIPILVQAIQEQQREIEALKAKLAQSK